MGLYSLIVEVGVSCVHSVLKLYIWVSVAIGSCYFFHDLVFCLILVKLYVCNNTQVRLGFLLQLGLFYGHALDLVPTLVRSRCI